MAPDDADTSAAGPSSSISEAQANYNDLRRLIPSLATELDHLRAALREHNLWLQRYGHAGNSNNNAAAVVSSSSSLPPPPPPSAGAREVLETSPPPPPSADPDLPAYSAPDVPPYTGGPMSHAGGSDTSTVQEVQERRDQLVEWLSEGEDVLREYSARFAQLGRELDLPPEDLLGTWNEASADNALPDYEVIETREELMVGGVGEVPPPYVRGAALGGSKGQGAEG